MENNQIFELAKQLIDKEKTENSKTNTKSTKKEQVANNNAVKQTRPYSNLELKIFDTADYTLSILEEMLKTAINQEEYCAFIYDSVHPDNNGKYNTCYRIEKILNKYAYKWQTKKVMEEKSDEPSPIATIKQINNLK